MSNDKIDKKEAWIIKKAKWKARFHNALTALAIIFVGTVLCSIITSLYYTSGNPNKMEVYRDVVRSTIAVTEPNIQFRGGGSGVKTFFNMDLEGYLSKRIGCEDVNAGVVKVSFLLSQAGHSERSTLRENAYSMPFRYPTSENPLEPDWEILERLPEGTVAEAYLSFDKLYSTDDVLKKFIDKNMQPVWFAVDTAFDDVNSQEYDSFVGFPYVPLWHHGDMTVTSHKEEKRGLFARTVSESAQAPRVEEYGSADLRNENFMDTLRLLGKYEKIANRIGGDLRISERISYLNSNGVKIYGIVVTGPSKEILKLQKESWVAGIHLGEVRLWNWEQ